MRIGRATIIPTILALGAAGSILAGSAAAVVAGPASSVHIQTVASTNAPLVYYHA
jgi:hypothetical protein